MRNLKLAFRTLFKSPFVTVVAIISLALGIGANAAIFSLFEQMLLRPLPVLEPGQLVNLGAPGPKPGSQSCNQAGDCDAVFSYAMYRDLEKAELPLAGIAGHRLFGANVAYESQTLNGEGVLVSGSYFPLLGLRPALGRLFTASDDETIGGHYVAVLGYDFWQNRLGADRDVIGRTININGKPLTIVGVAPEDFAGTTLGPRPLVYVPLTMRTVMSPTFDGFDNRRNYWLYLFARLEPGVALEQATVALNGVYTPIVNDVEAPLHTGMSEQTMQQFRTKQITVEPGRRGQSSMHAEAGTPMILLLATAGVVLLIACANIANLLLARGANRSMEMAVRLSLGAKRSQVLGQLLTESVVLALLGGAASLLVARWTLGGIGALLPAEASTMLDLSLSLPVIVTAAALAIGTGLLFGMFPALHSTRPDLVSTIRANAGNVTITRSAARFRATLVTAQIALSTALLICAGFFLKSLVNISRVDLGMNTENVVTFTVSPVLNGYEPERSHTFFARLEEELAALPGVSGVSAALVGVLQGNSWGNDVNVEGFERGPDINANSRFNQVAPAYFSTLDVPVLSGREFNVSDAAGAPRVAVVNEAFAKKFGLGREAVGKRMGMSGSGDELDIEIVGLVRDAKYNEVKDEVPPVFFLPWRQDEDGRVGSMTFYVRSSIDPAQVLRSVPQVVSQLDPNLPVESLMTLPQQVRENVFLDRMISTMSAMFAALATLLAGVGLYGVLAYTVARRTREIGVRMALGADRSYIRRMVLRQVGIMLAIGAVIGIATALLLGRYASSLLYDVRATDPFVVTAAVALLAVFALLAGFLPAHRASRVDPMQALRYE